MKASAAALLLALLCGLLFFSRLGAVAFFEEDEPRFAAAARTMVQSGDYITPRFNSQLRINKPILFYWLAAPSYAVFGANELGARFPSALLATAAVLLTFLFARCYGSIRFAAIAGVAVATCLQITILGRAAVADMAFIFFLTGALFAFFRAYSLRSGSMAECDGMEAAVSGQRRQARIAPSSPDSHVPSPDPRSTGDRPYRLLFWGALGMATLAKGPAAIVLAGGAIGLFLLLRGDLLAWARRMLTPGGLLLFALVAVPWYAMALYVHGQTFYRGFFLAEHFGRYGGVIDHHAGPVWYYLPVLLVMFYPWACFLPAGLAGVLRERRSETPLRLFALCWAAVVFGIFSFSGTKLPHYIAPLYPAAALLAAWAWEQRLNGEETRAWRASERILAWWGGLLAAAFAALIWLGPWLLMPLAGGALVDVGPAPVALALLFGVGWLGGMAFLALRRPGSALGVLGGALVGAILCLHLALAPVIARHWQEPLRDLAVYAAARAGTQGQLAIFAHASSGVVYYSERTVARVRREEADRLVTLAERAPLFVITTRRWAPEAPRSLGLQKLRRQGGFVLLGPPEEAKQ